MCCGELLHDDYQKGEWKYLIRVVVAPHHSRFNRWTKIMTSNRPVMLHWLEATAKEVLVLWFYNQRHGTTGKNVLQTNRPCTPFCIYFVPYAPQPNQQINDRTHQIYHLTRNYHLSADINLNLCPHWLESFEC